MVGIDDLDAGFTLPLTFDALEHRMTHEGDAQKIV